MATVEQRKFERRVRQLALRFSKRVGEARLEPTWSHVRDRDYRAAVTGLVAVAADTETAVYDKDLDDLKELLTHLGEPIDPLNVIDTQPDPPRMEIREFIQLVNTTIDRLTPKLEARPADRIRRSAEAGAWEVAIPELVAVLANEQIPVSPADRDDLNRLITQLGEPVEDIDRLIVEDGADQPSPRGVGATPPPP